jgi:hypothetical protein
MSLTEVYPSDAKVPTVKPVGKPDAVCWTGTPPARH